MILFRVTYNLSNKCILENLTCLARYCGITVKQCWRAGAWILVFFQREPEPESVKPNKTGPQEPRARPFYREPEPEQ